MRDPEGNKRKPIRRDIVMQYNKESRWVPVDTYLIGTKPIEGNVTLKFIQKLIIN